MLGPAVLGHVRAAAGNGRRTIPLKSVLVLLPHTRAIPHRSDHVASARTAYVRGTRELILGAVRLPRALACITPSPPAPGTHATGRNALRATPTPALAATPQDTHRDTEKSECKATPCIKVSRCARKVVFFDSIDSRRRGEADSRSIENSYLISLWLHPARGTQRNLDRIFRFRSRAGAARPRDRANRPRRANRMGLSKTRVELKTPNRTSA